jgi:hypothetical protein
LKHGWSTITRMPAAIQNPNYQGPFGNTLLHGAVVSGDMSEVRRLLAAGADPRIANRDGKTAAQAAAILGHAELYRLLSRRGDEHVESLLDQALEATFPASDPLAITQPSGLRDSAVQSEGDAAAPVILPIKRPAWSRSAIPLARSALLLRTAHIRSAIIVPPGRMTSIRR